MPCFLGMDWSPCIASSILVLGHDRQSVPAAPPISMTYLPHTTLHMSLDIHSLLHPPYIMLTLHGIRQVP